MRRIWCFAMLLTCAAPAAAQDMPLSQVLLPGEGWHSAAVDCKAAGGLAGDGRGNVFVADADAKQIWQIDKEGKASVFAKTADAVHGLAVGPDGRVFAAEPDAKEIVVYSVDGKQAAEYKDVAAEHLAVTKGGDVYCSTATAVYLLDREGKKRKVAGNLRSPGALVLWTDGGTLAIADAGDGYMYAFRVQKNGDLDARAPYYPFRARPNRRNPFKGVDAKTHPSVPIWEPSDNEGLALDAAGRAYATSREGVQIFDPTGRLSGVMVAPERAALGSIAFGGADLDRLYVACGGKVYVRKLLAKGVKAPEQKGT